MKIAEPKFIEVVNIGFGKRDDVLCKARNLALDKTIKEKFDFLYFYDVDIMSMEAILKDMIKYMNKERVGCVSPRVPLRGRTKEPIYFQSDPNLLQFQDIKMLNQPLPPPIQQLALPEVPVPKSRLDLRFPPFPVVRLSAALRKLPLSAVPAVVLRFLLS